MLRSLIDDLGRVEGVRVTTTRDARLPPLAMTGVEVHLIDEGQGWLPKLRELVASADAFWPLAPETGQALETLCTLCGDGDCLLLNSSARAVRCAASKYATARALERSGVPCVPTWRSGDDWHRWVDRDDEVVIKPDDGVACEGMRVTRAAKAGTLRADEVVQPFVRGRALSLGVLYGGGRHFLAGVNLQEIRCRDGQFLLEACVVNGVRDRRREFDALAAGVGEAIPGLAAYVGIDCIVRDERPCIVEVNPRLTTSYTGLRRSLGVNPSACIISLLTGNVPQFPDLESSVAVRVEL